MMPLMVFALAIGLGVLLTALMLAHAFGKFHGRNL